MIDVKEVITAAVVDDGDGNGDGNGDGEST